MLPSNPQPGRAEAEGDGLADEDFGAVDDFDDPADFADVLDVPAFGGVLDLLEELPDAEPPEDGGGFRSASSIASTSLPPESSFATEMPAPTSWAP
jgi:hypothetical protein